MLKTEKDRLSLTKVQGEIKFDDLWYKFYAEKFTENTLNGSIAGYWQITLASFRAFYLLTTETKFLSLCNFFVKCDASPAGPITINFWSEFVFRREICIGFVWKKCYAIN